MSSENQKKNGRLLSPKKAAKLAGVTPRTLRRWEENRLLSSTRTQSGNHRRYNESDVLRVASGEQSEPSRPAVRATRKKRPKGGQLEYPDHRDERNVSQFGPAADDLASDREEQLREKRLARQEALENELRAETLAKEEYAKKEDEWIKMLRRTGQQQVMRDHYVSSEDTHRHPPPQVIRAAIKDLKESLTIASYPLPANNWDFDAREDAKNMAKVIAQEHIDKWLASTIPKEELEDSIDDDEGDDNWEDEGDDFDDYNDDDDEEEEYDDDYDDDFDDDYDEE